MSDGHPSGVLRKDIREAAGVEFGEGEAGIRITPFKFRAPDSGTVSLSDKGEKL